jgi:hypothetical protein
MARGDWAVYGFVRAAIEARARLERVKEEKSQLQLHALRLVRWLCRRLAVLLEALDEPDSPIFAMNINTIIIHHYRVIKSLLKADAPLFGPEERLQLLTMQRQIDEKLAPENLLFPQIPARHGDLQTEEAGMRFDAEAINPLDDNNVVEPNGDGGPVTPEEDGINPELHEEEVGRYIADRLLEDLDQDLDQDLVQRYIADRIMEEANEELGISDGEADAMDLDP